MIWDVEESVFEFRRTYVYDFFDIVSAESILVYKYIHLNLLLYIFYIIWRKIAFAFPHKYILQYIIYNVTLMCVVLIGCLVDLKLFCLSKGKHKPLFWKYLHCLVEQKIMLKTTTQHTLKYMDLLKKKFILVIITNAQYNATFLHFNKILSLLLLSLQKSRCKIYTKKWIYRMH